MSGPALNPCQEQRVPSDHTLKTVKIVVTVMTVLILAGLGFVAYGLLTRDDGSAQKTKAFGTIMLDQPPGTRITAMTGTGRYMLLHLEGGQQEGRVAVIDLPSGRVHGVISVPPVP